MVYDVKKRTEVLPEHKWRLEDIIDSDAQFERLFSECKLKLTEIQKFKGSLNAENLAECLNLDGELSLAVEKLYVYAHMRGDEDTADNAYIELAERARLLAVDASSAVSFISPELARFPASTLKRLRALPEFADYDFFLLNILRNKKHLLSAKEERLLSEMSMFGGGYKKIFQVFDNADIRFDDVDVDGEAVKLSHGIYSVLLQNHNQEVRKAAFESLYAQYKAFTNTLAANYNGSVSRNVFYSRVRKFPSCLAQSLFAEGIPVKVYDNLINSVERHTPVLHRYIALRKRALGLSENHMYDMYVPITAETEKLYTFDEAYAEVSAALLPLGAEYAEILADAKVRRWIDVEETQNKRSGAYSWGVYGVHPFVLLNHRGTMHDVFTVAHELGHAIHSYYSNAAQPYPKAGYEIFVAEIASTVNEVLLIKHLLKKARGGMRKYLLSYYLDMFRTTLFRQTMFAEFERFSHESVEKGQPLSSDRLSAHYYLLNRKYYGDDVVHDDYIRYEWSRIPHFYNAFYVYKYATGLTCAVNIAGKLLKEDGFAEKYIEFLSSGGSDFPLNLLKKVGIDLTQKKAYDIAMKEFSNTLAALERMCK